MSLLGKPLPSCEELDVDCLALFNRSLNWPPPVALTGKLATTRADPSVP